MEPWRRSTRWGVAILLMLVTAIGSIDRQAMSIAASSIKADHHLTSTGYGAAASAFLAAYGVGLLLAGAFIVPGIAGLVRVLRWHRQDHLPEGHPTISDEEREFAMRDRIVGGDGDTSRGRAWRTWMHYLRIRETRGLVLAPFAGDGAFLFSVCGCPSMCRASVDSGYRASPGSGRFRSCPPISAVSQAAGWAST